MEEVKDQTNNLPESPASVNTRLKSPNGFVYQWTMRDEKNSNLIFKVQEMEKKWLSLGFTPVEQFSGFPKKQARPVEYVEGRMCPQCGSKLVYAVKKDGKKFIKCETNKYNPATRQAEGCSYIDWMDTPKAPVRVPEGSDYTYEEYV